MKTYRFDCRSTRTGFTEWAVVMENGEELSRIQRDVQLETVSQFRTRVAAELEAQGCTAEPNQYAL